MWEMCSFFSQSMSQTFFLFDQETEKQIIFHFVIWFSLILCMLLEACFDYLCGPVRWHAIVVKKKIFKNMDPY